MAYPTKKQLVINAPALFQPLSQWNSQLLEISLCCYNDKSPYDLNPLVLGHQKEFVEFRYREEFPDNEGFSDLVSKEAPLLSYGWYCPDSKRFSVTDSHAFFENIAANDFLKDIEKAELPAVDARVSFFP